MEENHAERASEADDDESGLPHVWHAACSLILGIAAQEYQNENPD